MGSIPNDRHLDPPDELEAPECDDCDGMSRVWDVTSYGYLDCDTCNGTGYQPAPEYDPPMEPEGEP